MAENSNIEWCDHTFNPWTGCTKVSPGCDHCYAEGWAKRSGNVTWGAGEPRRRTTPANWRKPLQWNAAHGAFFAERGRRQRVFCASLADIFDNAVDPSWRVDLFSLIEATPYLDWLLLTKRIGNVGPMIVEAERTARQAGNPVCAWLHRWACGVAPENVWLGATMVNQEEADRDMLKLFSTPASVRFLSVEPMLGPIGLSRWLDRCDHGSIPSADGSGGVMCPLCNGNRHGCTRIQWVIAGGESGPGARPMHPDWVRSLRDQCAAAGVPFLFKQWGEWAPYDRSHSDGAALATRNSLDEPLQRVGKKLAGRLLDGAQHDGYPEATP